MNKKQRFIITKYCPTEQIFNGEMTFTEARRFMDENACFDRRVGFKVFDNAMNRWEDIGLSFHGGRKVYDKTGDLFIIDPDYREMWRFDNGRWYIWEIRNGRRFIMSLSTKAKAEYVCSWFQNYSDIRNGQRQYVVEQCDIDI